MKVCIPFRNDFAGGTDLRFAIRSMVKYFTSMTGLILVGYRPNWYKGEFVPLVDLTGAGDYNMYRKLMAGAKDETVLYTTDDHFALQPFDETLPNYYWSTCGDKAKYHSSGRFRLQYQNCDATWKNFDIHVPMVIDTSKFKWQPETKYPIKSYYGGQNDIAGTPLPDLKFGNGHKYDQIKRIIEGKMFFSTSPFSQNADMMKVLNELYPEKTIYE